MQTSFSLKHVERIVAQVPDPEMPMVTIQDLGILKRVEVLKNHHFQIVMTPTFSGCPAMQEIEQSIAQSLLDAGVQNFKIVRELDPPWTSQRITPQGRKKLIANGIAVADEGLLCPRCQSSKVAMLSEFGATSCKSFARCRSCQEPFEVFKSLAPPRFIKKIDG